MSDFQTCIRRRVPLIQALGPQVIRKLILIAVVVLGSNSAEAICAGEPLSQQLRMAKYAFVATVTTARIVTPPALLRNGEDYRVGYTFDVLSRIKGDPTKVTALYSLNVFSDPKATTHFDVAEDVRLLPGDTVLVVADRPGEIQIGFCTASRVWDPQSRELEALRRRL